MSPMDNEQEFLQKSIPEYDPELMELADELETVENKTQAKLQEWKEYRISEEDALKIGAIF